MGTGVGSAWLLSRIVAIIMLAWPFDGPDWRALPYGTSHRGDDAFAQDWISTSGVSAGRAVTAPMDGWVVQAEWSCSSYGNTVVVWNRETRLAVRFAHLDRIDVTAGMFVDEGKALGTIGRTGPAPWCQSKTFGAPAVPHLHVAVYQHVDDPSGRPITALSLGKPSPYAAAFVFIQSPHPEQSNARPSLTPHPEPQPLGAFVDFVPIHPITPFGRGSAPGFSVMTDKPCSAKRGARHHAEERPA